MNNTSLTIQFQLPKCLTAYSPQTLESVNGDFLTTVYCALAVLTLISNIAFIVGLWEISNKGMTRSSKLFVLLSSIDMLLGGVYDPWTAYAIQVQISCTQEFVRGGLGFALRIWSCLTILLIAVDRYLTVVHTNIHKKYFTDFTVVVIVIVSAIIGIGFAVWYVSASPEISINSQGIPEFNFKTPAILYICGSIFIASVLVSAIVANVALSKSVTSTVRNSVRGVRKDSDDDSYDRVLSRTIMLICTAILVCYLPSVLCWTVVGLFYLVSTDRVDVPINGVIWLGVPDQLNCILNSCIYIVRNQKMRKFYKQAWYRMLGRHDMTNDGSRTG